jgi:Asp-tRNA(Asn)/Glu-tRNA(Gln) amidotransferase C subunit
MDVSASEQRNGDITMPKKKTTTRKSDYNPARASYLTADGKYYCYDTVNSDGKTVTIKIEVTPELEEITVLLDQMDYESDLSDRYQEALLDPVFKARQAREDEESDEDEEERLIETVPSMEPGPDAIVDDEAPENPLIEKVRAVVNNEFTEQQQDLYYKHYGMGQQFEQIRQDEAKRTGKLPGASAMTGRKDRMLNKVAKSLGAEPPKPRKK